MTTPSSLGVCLSTYLRFVDFACKRARRCANFRDHGERLPNLLQTQAGAAVYATRKTIVEPVLGQTKQARGFRQFLLGGLEKVQGEWAVVCLTHSMLKSHRTCYG
jgi:hypothetical protein